MSYTEAMSARLMLGLQILLMSFSVTVVQSLYRRLIPTREELRKSFTDNFNCKLETPAPEHKGVNIFISLKG